MKHEYTAVVKQKDEWRAGWIEEIPGVNCQETSCEELKRDTGGDSKRGAGM